MSLPGDVQRLQREQLEALAARPNTTVLDVTHDLLHDPWRSERLRPVMDRIVDAALAHGAEVDDFAVRKAGLADPEALALQREHPQLYWVLTDRATMREPRARRAVGAMLGLRERVERGEVAEGHAADALATQVVMAALGGAPAAAE